MRAVAEVVIAVVTTLFAASTVAAQARIDIVPSVSVGSVYDGNLFAEADGSAGRMLQIRPGFAASIESPRLKLGTFWTFDAQHSNHPDLSTLDARRHADGALEYRWSTATTSGFLARYDRTETPGEINFESGILGDRRQAHRWEVSPNVVHRLGPRTTLTGFYDYTDESLADNSAGQMHVARGGLARQFAPRTVITGTYLERHFVDPFDVNSSYAALGGFEHELTQATRVSLQAGPRVSSYRSVAAEIVAALTRNTRRMGLAVDYWHGETIVLGIRGPVAVNSGTARLTIPIRRTFEFGSHTAISDLRTLDAHDITTYHESLILSWSPALWWAVVGEYGLDYQQGQIRRQVFLDTNVTRHIFTVSLTVAPRVSRSIKSSDDPAARAKGVVR